MPRNIPEDGRFQTIAVRMAKHGNESFIFLNYCVWSEALLLIATVPGIGAAAKSFIGG